MPADSNWPRNARQKMLSATKTLLEKPHNRRPLTSERWQAKPSTGRLGFSRSRLSDGRFDAHPVARSSSLPERDTALHHPERSGVHANEYDFLATGSITEDLVRTPGVFERVVNVRNGRANVSCPTSCEEDSRRVDQGCRYCCSTRIRASPFVLLQACSMALSSTTPWRRRATRQRPRTDRTPA